MKFILHNIAIEMTRRCNAKCHHCMRGEAQNIDVSKEIIDSILNNEEISQIDHICFSGGEPTLNADMIIYAINKIIAEKINVLEIAMVTNGQIFNRGLVEAFNRFINYRKQVNGKDSEDYARITFSVDRFHPSISQEVVDNYLKYSRGITLTKYAVKDEDIYQTGFANQGKDFNYQLDQLRYILNDQDDYWVLDNLYFTANGYITSEGMGQYTDMDRINMGHISNTSISEVLAKYGTPNFGAPKIVLNNDEPKKKVYHSN